MIAGTDFSRSASGITTSEFFAPPRACTRLPSSAPRLATNLAVEAWPTKEIASTPGSASRVSTASRPPWTRLTTPSGIEEIVSTSSTISSAGRGSRSEGFSTKVFPAAIAFGRNQSGIIAGKLNGVIAATTPTGCRTSSTSIPRAAPSRFSPFIRCGTAAADSTDSIPRPTSPRASTKVLPMSSVTSLARSSRRVSRASRRSSTARARCGAGTARQPGWASAAARTAASTSARPERGTLASTSPEAGSRSSRASAATASVQAPPT